MEHELENLDPALEAPLKIARKVAEKHGYALNPDPTQLRRLLKQLADNKANFGRYFCPCKQHYPLQPDNDPVCPCSTFHEEIKQQGNCVCHLFFDPEAAERARQRPGLLANVTCPG